MMSGSNNPMYGKHVELTEEQRKKLSEAQKGENNPFYSRKHSEETKQIMRSKHYKNKPVVCCETGIVYI